MNKNKRLAAIVTTAAAAMLALSGCSGSSDMPTDSASDVSPFVTAVYDNTDFDYVPAAELTRLGNKICNGWAAGMSVDDMSLSVVSGMTEGKGGEPLTEKEIRDGAYVIFASTNFLCPEYLPTDS